MKLYLLSAFSLFLGWAVMSVNPLDTGFKNKSTVISKGLLNFKNNIEVLQSEVYLFSEHKIPLEKLQETLKSTRNSYKEIEFYITYHYPEYAKTNLNAAPLFRIEAAGTSAYTLPPEGLQVLDELIFSDEANDESARIIEITDYLYNSFNNFYLSSISNGLSSGNNKTLALRMELIRIYTLGITGFDTPGSLNTSEEAGFAFLGMKKYVNDDLYFNNYDLRKANLILTDGIVYLSKNRDFETFDRIEFYKSYIQPLYEELGNWDGSSDGLKDFSGWNVSSRNFFSSDFLNPYFYTILRDSEDKMELKNLGKEIFYDESFSDRGKMSCASCHLPENAFTDLQSKSGSNVAGKSVLRNSPSLYNAVFAKRFFYDMRAFYLEQQAEHVIYSAEEYNTSYKKIIKKLKAEPSYKKAFRKVFKDGQITKQNFSKALTSYVASLYSFESDFDRFMRNEKEISEVAKKGFNLFMGKANCATCHFAPLFSGLVPPFFNENESEVLGVTEKPLQISPIKIDDDKGRSNNSIAKEKSWIYENSFKTMTVRNSALTKPYFHNGAFNTLEEVLNFYNEGGAKGLGLSISNQTLPAEKLNLTTTEIQQIIAFLHSLTDISRTKN